MPIQITRYWWLWLLRGLLAIVLGVLAFIMPGATLAALVMLFGIYLVVDGVFALAAAWRGRGHYGHWWLLLLEGMVDVVAGVLMFLWPGLTALILLYFLAAWAVVSGVLMIAAAIGLRRLIAGEWLLAQGGVLSVLLGVLLLLAPRIGLLVWTWMVGVYALAFGVGLTAFALRLRRLGENSPPAIV